MFFIYIQKKTNGKIFINFKNKIIIFYVFLTKTLNHDLLVHQNQNGMKKILMSLTAPGCPVAGEMPGWVSDAVKPIEGLNSVLVEIVWEPQWGMEMMSDEARLELGFM